MTQAQPDASQEALWMAQLCKDNHYTDPVILPNGRYAAVAPFLFTHAIILGRIFDKDSYQDRWCYKTYDLAKQAIEEWDGTGEPTGWHRHPLTGRRRTENGNEYINK